MYGWIKSWRKKNERQNSVDQIRSPCPVWLVSKDYLKNTMLRASRTVITRRESNITILLQKLFEKEVVYEIFSPPLYIFDECIEKVLTILTMHPINCQLMSWLPNNVPLKHLGGFKIFFKNSNDLDLNFKGMAWIWRIFQR